MPVLAEAPDLVWAFGLGHQLRVNLSGHLDQSGPDMAPVGIQPPAFEDTTDQFRPALEETRATLEYRFHPDGGFRRFHLFVALGLEEIQANLPDRFDGILTQEPSALPMPFMEILAGTRLVKVVGAGFDSSPALAASFTLATMKVRGQPLNLWGFRVSWRF